MGYPLSVPSAARHSNTPPNPRGGVRWQRYNHDADVGRTGKLTRRILPVAIAAFVFIGMAALYANNRTETYKAMLEWWGVDAFPSPFVDIETVLSAVRCLGRGVDIFATNPCDPVRVSTTIRRSGSFSRGCP